MRPEPCRWCARPLSKLQMQREMAWIEQTHHIFDQLAAAIAHQSPPREQLAGAHPMPTRRCRHTLRHHQALLDNPLLCLRRPATARARRNHLKARDLRHSRMVSHTTMSSAQILADKTAFTEGIRSMRSTRVSIAPLRPASARVHPSALSSIRPSKLTKEPMPIRVTMRPLPARVSRPPADSGAAHGKPADQFDFALQPCAKA